MIPFYKSILSLAALLVSCTVFSATPAGKMMLPRKETNSKLTAYDNDPRPYVVKTNFIRSLRGEAPLLFEYPLSKRWSLELGPSVTFENVMAMWLYESESIMPKPWANSEIPFKAGYSLPGYGFTGFIKLFTSNDEWMSGHYFGIQNIYGVHRFSYVSDHHSMLKEKAMVRQTGIFWGYQTYETVFSEFNVGIGVRKYTLDFVQTVAPYNRIPATASMVALFFSFKRGINIS